MTDSSSSSSPARAEPAGALTSGQRMEVRWTVGAAAAFLLVLALLPLVGPAGWRVEWRVFNRAVFAASALVSAALAAGGALRVRPWLHRPPWALVGLAALSLVLLLAGLSGWAARI